MSSHISDHRSEIRSFAIKPNHLECIIEIQARSPKGLTRRERDMFHFILTALIVNPNADRIKSSIGHISSCMKNANLVMSKSTVRRALSDLEKRGYIYRRKCRLGEDRLGIELVINISMFSFWLQRPVKNVCPIPTTVKKANSVEGVYISTHHSIRLDEECTNEHRVINTDKVSINSNHARARENNSKKYELLKNHSLLLTLWCLLRGSPNMKLYNRAEREFLSDLSGNSLNNHSGVPWLDYQRNWDDMLHSARDSYAKTQIIPKLKVSSENSDYTFCAGAGVENETALNCDGESQEEIRKLIYESLQIPYEHSG